MFDTTNPFILRCREDDHIPNQLAASEPPAVRMATIRYQAYRYGLGAFDDAITHFILAPCFTKDQARVLIWTTYLVRRKTEPRSFLS